MGGVESKCVGDYSPGGPMDSFNSSTTTRSNGGKTYSTVGSLSKAKHPMPDHNELERRFAKILASMDLPPDKAKLLRQYDDHKKWDMICDQELVSAKDPPAHYLDKLRTYLDPKASRSSRKRKMVGDSTSTQVLRDLEISLRTNSIEWVREFLSEDNQGHIVLVDYLAFRLMMMRHEQRVREEGEVDDSSDSMNNSNGNTSRLAGNSTIGPDGLNVDHLDSPRMKRASRHVQKLNMGESKDDIHVGIMCLRAIMNNKFGFNMIFEHREAINCIALSLNHYSLRTKALVLELLAAICLVKGGHQIILRAFNHFKDVCGEPHRFYTLMQFFTNSDRFQIEFMIACMQFINIIVHSVEDMNFRVHLQYEFSRLGMDEYLEKLRHHESEELQVQISAYLDNVFDVAALMEDSETKTAALERLSELEEELAHSIEKLRESEASWLAKSVEMETELDELRKRNQELLCQNTQVMDEVTTLRKTASQREEQNRQQQIVLEHKIHHLETLSRSGSSSLNGSTSSIPGGGGGGGGPPPPPPPAPPPMPNATVAPPPPPPPSVPTPPRLPGMLGSSFRPPPPMPGQGELQSPMDAMTIKRKVTTKYKLPTLNWVALKPNQVRGTIFNELDDEKLHKVIDFNSFEEEFKIGNTGVLMANGDISETDSLNAFGSKRFKKPELTSLMEHTRLRNIAISRRKLELPVEVVTRAVNSLDLQTLHLDNVELLQRMVPNEQEVKAYREYERNRNPLHQLTEEDQYMFYLTKIDRLATKLSIMSFLANFTDNLHCITPQIHALITASRSVKNSTKLRRLLEIILAFGNYMNSSKRGPAYGFKLSSLDNLGDTKSAKKKISLLHYIQDTVRVKFPEVNSFDSDLRGIENAAQVSLENILTDLSELDKGMEAAKKELDRLRGHKGPEAQHATSVLNDFLSNTVDKLKKLKSESKIGQEAFSEALEYFGESSRALAPNTFFAIFVRLCKAYKAAENDNAQRRKIEAAQRAAALAAQQQQQLKDSDTRNMNEVNKTKISPRKHQEAVIGELRARGMVADKRLLSQEDVYHGALEDILIGLRNEPYRRADAVRRSHRKRDNSARLSRTLDDNIEY